jgi:Fur family peroxide stress response transcriptional regulator
MKVMLMQTQRKNSQKRAAIYKLLSGTRAHPSAEWIYEHLKPDFPSVSLGTVYRNLSLLRDDGLIKSVGTVSGEERFDAAVHEHPHFICEVCGEIIDLEITDDELPKTDDLAEKLGLLVTRRELYYYGTCDKCASKA